VLPQPQQKIDCGGLLDTTTLFELGAGAQWIVPFALGKDGFVLSCVLAKGRWASFAASAWSLARRRKSIILRGQVCSAVSSR